MRRAAAFLAGGALLGGLLQVHTAPAAYAATNNGSRTAEVAVDSLTPAVPTKGGTITVSGTVTNDGSQTITGAHIGLRMAPGGPLSSRSAMSAAASRTGFSTTADGYELTGHQAAVKDIPAGISLPFSLKVPVSDLGLGNDGVYQLGVSLTGLIRSTGYEQILGIQRTFLPWYQAGGTKKTQLTFLWPLIDRPHLAVRSGTDDQQSPIFLDDSLAQELAPGGRLRQLLDLGKDLPVTWVIDPDLLATVDAMTKKYQVAGDGGDLVHTTSGTGTADANQWLSDLKGALTGQKVMALPFADPDIASIAHSGKEVPGTLAHLKSATDLATTTVESILGTTPETDAAWPVEGAVDPSVVAVATSAGADKVIARSDSLSESGSLDYTPSAARPIGGGTTAVVADSALSKTFRGDMLSARKETLAVQKFISQTLLITEQAPKKQRSIVVAPQRMPTGSQAQAMAEAISTVTQSGWAQAATFTAAAKATPDPGANRKVPGSGSYPKSLRKQELDTDAFRQIQATQSALNGFRVILSHPDRVDTPFTNALLRSMSTQWRGSKAGAKTFRDATGDYLNELKGLVHILSKSGTLTLSGRSATIPVTVKNELGQAVSGLELRLTSSQSNSLTVGNPQQVTVGGGHTKSLKFGATARRNGLTSITAQLYTTDGARYGNAMTFKVYVTSITSTVMLVIAVGLLLLVLAGVRMYHQRKRKAAATAEETNGDGGDGNGDNGNGPDPEQPGDPAPDTSPESLEPSATGEKVDS
ncbi:hypothetical protein FCI23_11630 [Actinacidiphila oryziradicis]|uniref:Uncharacterized protein n=1 Tax=Actinacidiphila oryziradicis TaxID=2571141 RepID=A0A4U0ST39_9ACTN|nr:hypothetical protein FCI23_11630 [Actinacidiphila oryziradicis]